MNQYPADLYSLLGSKEKMAKHLLSIITQYITEQQSAEHTPDHLIDLIQDENSEFPYPAKLLICELLATDEHKKLRNLISPVLNKTADAPKFGIFHTGKMHC